MLQENFTCRRQRRIMNNKGRNHLGKCLKWLQVSPHWSGTLKQDLISLEMIEIKNVWNFFPPCHQVQQFLYYIIRCLNVPKYFGLYCLRFCKLLNGVVVLHFLSSVLEMGASSQSQCSPMGGLFYIIEWLWR